ncbi:MAG: sigma-70 family RNA polymerase sigma factor [Planctomycetota bacterium]
MRAWLATVLRHRAQRHGQREAMRQRHEGAVASRDAEPPVHEILATAQLHRAVVDAVLALHEPGRSAVVLRYLDELPLHQVAQRLGVPIETARTRIKRGLDQLRTRLDERWGGRAAWAALLIPNAHPSLTLTSLTLLMGTKSTLTAGCNCPRAATTTGRRARCIKGSSL